MNRLLFKHIFEEYFLKNFSDLRIPIPGSTSLSQELTFWFLNIKIIFPNFVNFSETLFYLYLEWQPSYFKWLFIFCPLFRSWKTLVSFAFCLIIEQCCWSDHTFHINLLNPFSSVLQPQIIISLNTLKVLMAYTNMSNMHCICYLYL